MKAKNNFTRKAKPLKGADEATKPRTHAHEKMSETGGGGAERRTDLLRRHMLSTRKDPKP